MNEKSDDFSEIRNVIQEYLDGIYFGSAEKLKSALHADARMICPSEGQYINIGMPEYFSIVAQRSAPHRLGHPRQDTIHSIEIANGEIAIVRLRCLVLGKDCEDMLTLARTGGAWSIVSKVFCYKTAD